MTHRSSSRMSEPSLSWVPLLSERVCAKNCMSVSDPLIRDGVRKNLSRKLSERMLCDCGTLFPWVEDHTSTRNPKPLTPGTLTP